MVSTTPSQCLEIIPRVCAESSTVFQKKIMEGENFVTRKVTTVHFDPHHDVIYFLHEFVMRVGIGCGLLDEFAIQFSAQATRLRTLALPGAAFFWSAKGAENTLRSLRAFKNLRELAIVLCYFTSHASIFWEIPQIPQGGSYGTRDIVMRIGYFLMESFNHLHL